MNANDKELTPGSVFISHTLTSCRERDNNRKRKEMARKRKSNIILPRYKHGEWASWEMNSVGGVCDSELRFDLSAGARL